MIIKNLLNNMKPDKEIYFKIDDEIFQTKFTFHRIDFSHLYLVFENRKFNNEMITTNYWIEILKNYGDSKLEFFGNNKEIFTCNFDFHLNENQDTIIELLNVKKRAI